ncbi:MAG TPA: MFS transporter [Novosphingobium sp.]|nr:MFS transporter [Novosphingobium sp.]
MSNVTAAPLAATGDAVPEGHLSDGPEPLTGLYNTYAMTLLLSLYMVNFLDRQVVNILAEPIKRDLGLADWQLGLLTGLSFALLYSILGIPIAWLAERRSRPVIIGMSATIWSVFTIVCAFTQNFAQLVLARVGVGVGEAGCTPAAQSLIMDYAKPEKRSSALAYYGIGAPLGGLLGMAFGGLVADAYGWRTAFLIAGLPGLALGALAAFTLREPRRKLAVHPQQAKSEAAGFRETLRALVGRPAYVRWVLGVTMMSVVVYGMPSFFGSFYLRNHGPALENLARTVGAATGMNLGAIGVLGLSLGLIMGAAGVSGMWLGGQLADRYGRGEPRRYLRGVIMATALGVPLMVGVLTAPTLGLSFVFLAAKGFVWSVWYGPAYAAGFSVVPRNMRAVSSALALFVNNLIGAGLAPVAVGVVSDLIGAHMGAAEGLRWSMALFSLCGFISSAIFYTASRSIEAEAEK